MLPYFVHILHSAYVRYYVVKMKILNEDPFVCFMYVTISTCHVGTNYNTCKEKIIIKKK